VTDPHCSSVDAVIAAGLRPTHLDWAQLAPDLPSTSITGQSWGAS
jgi:hypothetical protein